MERSYKDKCVRTYNRQKKSFLSSTSAIFYLLTALSTQTTRVENNETFFTVDLLVNGSCLSERGKSKGKKTESLHHDHDRFDI
jgi:hypothetical protein